MKRGGTEKTHPQFRNWDREPYYRPFELVIHTGDHHWELESRTTAYLNVHQSAAILRQNDVIKIHTIIRVPVTGAGC